jgi:hypothetical protein
LRWSLAPHQTSLLNEAERPLVDSTSLGKDRLYPRHALFAFQLPVLSKPQLLEPLRFCCLSSKKVALLEKDKPEPVQVFKRLGPQLGRSPGPSADQLLFRVMHWQGPSALEELRQAPTQRRPGANEAGHKTRPPGKKPHCSAYMAGVNVQIVRVTQRPGPSCLLSRTATHSNLMPEEAETQTPPRPAVEKKRVPKGKKVDGLLPFGATYTSSRNDHRGP